MLIEFDEAMGPDRVQRFGPSRIWSDQKYQLLISVRLEIIVCSSLFDHEWVTLLQVRPGQQM